MPRWTPETRLKQAAAIRTWMPWTPSTGPVTAAGKARVARNAWKGGVRTKVKNWHGALRRIGLITESLYSLIRPKREKHQMAGAGPMHPVSSAVSAWDLAAEEEEADDDDEMDTVDRMSSAEVQAALIRLGAWKPPATPI